MNVLHMFTFFSLVGPWNSIQLFHACSGNSQNYWPEVLEMTWELLPEAEGNSSQVISSTEGQ
jgi:hypothetical protein